MDTVAQRNALAGGQGLPDMEGWLHKQSDKYRTWNKRWFVLKGPNLLYFKGPKVKSCSSGEQTKISNTQW